MDHASCSPQVVFRYCSGYECNLDDPPPQPRKSSAAGVTTTPISTARPASVVVFGLSSNFPRAPASKGRPGVTTGAGCGSITAARPSFGLRLDAVAEGLRANKSFGAAVKVISTRTARQTPGGGVQLVKQRSKTACIENQTWGSDQRGIWVDQGCDAEFQVAVYRRRGRERDYRSERDGYTTPPPVSRAGTLQCRSDNYNYRHCRADTRSGVQLARQFSQAACIQGETWGYDQRGGVGQSRLRGRVSARQPPRPRA